MQSLRDKIFWGMSLFHLSIDSLRAHLKGERFKRKILKRGNEKGTFKCTYTCTSTFPRAQGQLQLTKWLNCGNTLILA